MSGGMSGGICPGESIKLWFCGYVGMSVTQVTFTKRAEMPRPAHFLVTVILINIMIMVKTCRQYLAYIKRPAQITIHADWITTTILIRQVDMISPHRHQQGTGLVCCRPRSSQGFNNGFFDKPMQDFLLVVNVDCVPKMFQFLSNMTRFLDCFWKLPQTRISNFRKLMRHTEGMVKSIIWILLETYFSVQQ